MPQLKTGADADEDSGNFALLDIIKALQFVRRNIANFGGDPSNVTLMGQSAGAINVYALLTSPLVVNASPALFHRAAPLSGGISLRDQPAARPPPDAEPGVGLRRRRATRCSHNMLIADGLAADAAAAQAWVASQTDAQIAAYLRAQDAGGAAVHAADQARAARRLAGSGPIPDGVVLPTDPIAAIAPATTCACRCWRATRATRASCSRPS